MPIVADAVIDTALVNELVSLVKTVIGLFAEFPLNVILIGSLFGVALGIFGMAKRAAKK